MVAKPHISYIWHGYTELMPAELRYSANNARVTKLPRTFRNLELTLFRALASIQNARMLKTSTNWCFSNRKLATFQNFPPILDLTWTAYPLDPQSCLQILLEGFSAPGGAYLIPL